MSIWILGLICGAWLQVVEGGVGDDAFYKWAVESLAPVLNRYDEHELPNSILLLDNATIHHQPRFIKLLDDIGCLVFYLSPYSPDFSAIEPCFHSLKDWLKRHREEARSSPTLALRTAMEESVTPQHMVGHFRQCGYPLEASEADEEAIGMLLCCAAAEEAANAGW